MMMKSSRKLLCINDRSSSLSRLLSFAGGSMKPMTSTATTMTMTTTKTTTNNTNNNRTFTTTSSRSSRSNSSSTYPFFFANTTRACTTNTNPNTINYSSSNNYDYCNSSSTTIRAFSSSIIRNSNNTMIGFIGLGNMGLPMCTNLAKFTSATSGSFILAFDVNKDVTTNLVEDNKDSNIIAASSIEEIGQHCSTIITMLPGCDSINHVMETLLPVVKNKTIFIDCSTISPITSRYWHKTLFENGQHRMFDAPVSGGVKGAKNQSLTFMVGGTDNNDNDKDDNNDNDNLFKNHVSTILYGMGSKVIPCGGPGSGTVIKLCNNMALATQMIGICEAMNLGETLNVDPIVLANVLNISTAKCWSCESNNPHPKVAAATNSSPASNDYNGGFSTKLMLKDLKLVTSVANSNANLLQYH